MTMLKALYRKQMAELGSFITRDPKTGSLRSKKSRRGYIFVLILIGLLLLGAMGALALGISGIIAQGHGWAYMSIMSVLAVLLGVFGSVFNTYSGLYLAKDNEFLLSMPIPERYILLVRMIGVYIMGAIYSAFVMVPAVVLFLLFSPVTAGRVIFSVLSVVTVSLTVLALSCILGWVVARISARLKNKSMITVIVTVAFLALYFWFCGNSGKLITTLTADPTIVERAFRGWLFLFGWLGRGADGAVLPFLLSLAFSAGLSLAVWYVLSRSFLHLTTSTVGSAKKTYTAAPVKGTSIRKALRRREWKHFLSSPTYMLNCGIGVLFSVAVAVVGLLNIGKIRLALSAMVEAAPGFSGATPLIVAATLCFLATMIDVSAPSVSLEGKTLWLIQSFPVEPREALMAKLTVHMELALPTVIVAGAVFSYALGMSVGQAVTALLLASLFALFTGGMGLLLNLKMPNLSWTTETVPIKQSAPVTISLFGGWALVLVLGAAYYFLRNAVSADVFSAACIVLLALADRFVLNWIRKKGAEIFASL